MSGPHKRRHSSSSSDDISDCHLPKKLKLHYPPFPPRRFWEGLSEIPLTKNALQALNEENSQQSPVVLRHRQHQHRLRPRPHSKTRTRRQSADKIVRNYSEAASARLKAFARHGGPDLTVIRGFSQPSITSMSSSQSSLGRRKRASQSPATRSLGPPTKDGNTTKTTSTKSTGPYDRAFQQHLIDHNILPHRYEYPGGELPPEPDNLEDIRQALSQPRASLSPSKFTKDDFRKFERADAQAFKERDVTTNVIPIIEGHVNDRRCVAGEIPFTNLEHLTDGTLVPGNPDLYYGARPEQLHKTVRQKLRNLIVPSTQHDLPIVPNYCLQVKGPDGNLSVATRQASYDGALAARGIASLQSYNLQGQQHDNNAYTITSTYHGGQLKMYTSHPIPPTDGKEAGFVMTQIKTWGMTGDADTFRQGATAFRNGRDWAEKQRDKIIKQVNNRVSCGPGTVSISRGLGLSLESDTSLGEQTAATSQETLFNPHSRDAQSYESDTSADELSLEFQPRAKRNKSPQKI
ncbi:hypothetical protein AAL_07813 [Moelleriella libera RCEF 2490]|uniref:DUF7924 domain-containing protein n=1 Tax=Moelleriella libera RCEF 2490 TaxID=1081109 RepID=A0A167WR02_9HYPO|nr:hypothetical protein AAL_07813 [Moelleriella libera RCEF 2490]